MVQGSTKQRGWAQRLGFAAALPLFLNACDGVQSTLNSEGIVARRLMETWPVLLVGGTAVLALVIVLLLYAAYRAPDKRANIDVNYLIIGGGIVLPVVTLTALLLFSFHITNIAYPDWREEPLRIEVTGNQWWWEVRYPELGVVTANEIHIPAGRPVEVRVESADVIHSFWVPNLAGKMDVLPGRPNLLWMQAERPGVYRGQCAEFCGAQHAHMALLVIAQPSADFAGWAARQRRPAVRPETAAGARGLAAFFVHGCPQCHTVRGTGAGGTLGPDLTHVGSRRTLAAVTLDNSHDNLALWIARNQAVKPGNLMPSFAHLGEGTLHDLATYLGHLQ